MSPLFALPVRPCLPIVGSDQCFPVRRIYCVGRNYAEHAREMGALDQADGREPPFFFAKPGDAVVGGLGCVTVHYPPLTANLHHEVELVAVLGAGGANVSVQDANALIYGYAVGLDLTRRDMQARAKEKAHPWDMSKGFDQSAVIGGIVPASVCGHPRSGCIELLVNGDCRQRGDLADMLWKMPEVVANLSTFVRLEAGDMIYTGTPAGVGPLVRGDQLQASVAGVASLSAHIV